MIVPMVHRRKGGNMTPQGAGKETFNEGRNERTWPLHNERRVKSAREGDFGMFEVDLESVHHCLYLLRLLGASQGSGCTDVSQRAPCWLFCFGMPCKS